MSKGKEIWTPSQVVKYRKAYEMGQITVKEIVKEFGCSQLAVERMLKRETYQDAEHRAGEIEELRVATKQELETTLQRMLRLQEEVDERKGKPRIPDSLLPPELRDEEETDFDLTKLRKPKPKNGGGEN